MARRRLWEISKSGHLDRLRLLERDLPPPQSGQVRVAVKAIGLNFADVFACLGLYSATPQGSFTPGLEFAGVVEEAGSPRSAGMQPGDQVMGLTRFGAYATRINADYRYLRPLPPGWDFASGAAFGAQAMTAFYACRELGNLEEGQAVLVHSAAGGVGLHCVRLALNSRAEPVCTVGSMDKVDFLASRFGLPRDRVIVRDRKQFGRQLDAALDQLDREGFDLILDSVAGPYFRPGYRRLARGGRLVLFGAADFMPAGKRPQWLSLGLRYMLRPRLDPLEMIAENRSLMAFNLIWLWDRVDELERLYRQMGELLQEPPFVGRTFAFQEAPAALRFLQSGRNLGKVVLLVEEA